MQDSAGQAGPGGGQGSGPFGKLVVAAPNGQEQEFVLAKPEVTLGRATTNDVVLSDPRVSRFHVRLECAPEGCSVVDLGSGNGTLLNGARVQRAMLAPGDVLVVGESSLRFLRPGSAGISSMTLAEVPIPGSEDDLAASVGSESLVYTLPDTSVPRVAVQLGAETWEIRMTGDALSIGRAPQADIRLDHPRVSRQHARLERRDGAVWIVDLGSRNGTWIGGRRITDRQLDTGTEVRIGPATLVFKGAFTPEDLTVVGGARPRAATRPLTRLPVVFVPGFMGSEMWGRGRRLWPNVHAALADPEIFSWPDKQLEPRSILREHVIIPNFISLARYSRLVDYLEEDLGYRRGADLLEFAYDWRQDNRVSARLLGNAIAEWRSARGHGDVAVVAHSMGCLIARYYVERLGGRDHVRRLALIGGLNGGSPKTFQAFVGASGLLAFNQMRARFQRVVAGFPSVYQSLPIYPCVVDKDGKPIDVFTEDAWLPEDKRPLLRDGAAFFAELGTATSVPTVCVFGYGLKTPVRLVVERDGDGSWTGTRMELDDRGDDTIPQESAVMDGAEIHPVRQHHGVLYTDADVRMRLRLELVGP